MTATLTIDSNGAISLPKSFLDKFHLKPGATLLADVSDEGIALRPEDEMERSEALKSPYHLRSRLRNRLSV
jgi:AbrB family looped-hinge helix DNA binding protein